MRRSVILAGCFAMLCAGCQAPMPVAPQMPISTLMQSQMKPYRPSPSFQRVSPQLLPAASKMAVELYKRFPEVARKRSDFLVTDVKPTAQPNVCTFYAQASLEEDGADILVVEGTFDARTGALLKVTSEHTSA